MEKRSAVRARTAHTLPPEPKTAASPHQQSLSDHPYQATTPERQTSPAAKNNYRYKNRTTTNHLLSLSVQNQPRSDHGHFFRYQEHDHRDVHTTLSNTLPTKDLRYDQKTQYKFSPAA